MIQLCVLVNDKGEILETRSDIDPEKVQTKVGFTWLPVEVVEKPKFDVAKSEVDLSYDVVEGKVVQQWTIRDKTVEEKTVLSERVMEVPAAPLVFVIGLDQENRIRALEGLPSLTMDEFREAVKARLK